MRIGSTEIVSIIDGEILGPPAFMYPEQSPADLVKAQPFLDPTTGKFVYTIGSHLIRTADRLVLVDTGIGPLPTPPSSGGGLRSSLLAVGVDPADITDVVFTHLHFDHIGWAVQDGEPFFRNAVYRADRRDWEHFMAPDYQMTEWEPRATNPETDRAGVRLAPIADRVDLWDGDGEILPGLDARDAAGHTPGTVAFEISSDGERGVLLGDIVHSIPELLHGWTFRSHLDSDTALGSAIAIRDWLADEGLPCSGAHFPGLVWGRVVRDGEDFRWANAD